ncbi:MAG: alanine dehydrogenase [Alphaproteobacteria bacterium]
MIVGTLREAKDNEYRVGLTPESVRELVAHGHDVLVESGAGRGIDAPDDAYARAGATVVPSAEAVFAVAELIVKVKELLPHERDRLHARHVLFTYLHLAPDPEQTAALVASGATCIAYETVTDRSGGLPLLRPMSQVAGRMSIQAGASALEKEHGGRGVLLGGVPGVGPAKVIVIGGGVVGMNAAQMAVGLGADVTILDRDPAVLERLATHFETRAKTRFATRAAVDETVAGADLVVGAVLVPGARTPRLVSREMLATMQAGAVLVDVAIDQGGCFETSRPTTHAAPTYVEGGIVHYAVANMPGAVARTSTYALNNATLPHVLALADRGWRDAMRADPHLRAGLNVQAGQVTNAAVAVALGYDLVAPEEVLG